MSKVLKLGITSTNNKKINEVKTIEVIKNKGVLGDRHFNDFNDPYCQLTLIESENIDYYNSKYGLNFSYLEFRRNIITRGIQLNNLVGKKFLIGKVKAKEHRENLREQRLRQQELDRLKSFEEKESGIENNYSTGLEKFDINKTKEN